MLDSSSSADFEGANSEQKRIKLEEQQLGQSQGKVSAIHPTPWGAGGLEMFFPSKFVHSLYLWIAFAGHYA